ncbi:hypothetical protein EV182_005137, partial [Spiromyces aspiralis]
MISSASNIVSNAKKSKFAEATISWWKSKPAGGGNSKEPESQHRQAKSNTPIGGGRRIPYSCPQGASSASSLVKNVATSATASGDNKENLSDISVSSSLMLDDLKPQAVPGQSSDEGRHQRQHSPSSSSLLIGTSRCLSARKAATSPTIMVTPPSPAVGDGDGPESEGKGKK